MLEEIKGDFECFFHLDECISTLDILTSLADYASSLEVASRPKFTNYLKLENSIHPFIETINENAIKIDDDDDNLGSVSELVFQSSLVLITGANMSGKSSLLKKIGNLQVMAQLGSYLPASSARLILKKKLLSHSNGFVHENIALKKSSFELEMTEISYIIKNLESDSLILIDELCRSTNYYEGKIKVFILLQGIDFKKKKIYFN